MRKLIIVCAFFLTSFLFHSCFVNTVIPKEEILKNIYLRDYSSIGLLNFCNFSGKVENNNRFKIDNVQLRGFVYNTVTKQQNFYNFKLGVPVKPNGSATYQEKIFVGKGINFERVEIISAEKSY